MEPYTDARYNVVFDIYNAISFSCMHKMMTDICEPQLIINYDATQYKVGYESGKLVSSWHKSERFMQKKALKSDNQGITSYFIKYFCMINAFGNTADPVFIVADDKMNEDEIDVHTITGLGCTTYLKAKGYVIFWKSRAGNKQFFEWFNNKVVIKFIS